MKTLETFIGNTSFAEIYQKVGLYFSFVLATGDTLKPLHGPVVCRDFLNDAVFSSQIKEDIGGIWGFKLDGSKTPIDTAKTRLVLKFGDSASMVSFEKLFPLLNDLERSAKFELSEFSVVKDNSDHLYIEGDRRWVQNGLMISIYTHLLRMLACESSETLESKDLDDLSEIIAEGYFGNNTSYCRAYNKSTLRLDKFIQLSDDIFARYNLWGDPDNLTAPNIHAYHDHSGFQGLLKQYNSKATKGLSCGWAEEYRRVMDG